MSKCSAQLTPTIMNLRSAKPGVPERKSADALGGWYHCAGSGRKDGLWIQHG